MIVRDVHTVDTAGTVGSCLICARLCSIAYYNVQLLFPNSMYVFVTLDCKGCT